MKIKWSQKKIKLAVCGTGIVILAAIGACIILFSGGENTSDRLETKIKDYSERYGISVADIKKDTALLEELTAEANYELRIDELTKNITVTEEEIENYKQMIGNDMNVKKALFLLFNTYDDCKAFIETADGDYSLSDIPNATVPLMEKDDEGQEYFNVVGNEALEAVFDSLADGEYTKEPFDFSGMYCYMKRLGISSPISSDDKITEMIKHDKAQEKLNEGR